MKVEKPVIALVLRKILETRELHPELEAALRLGHEPIVFEDGGAYCVSTGTKVIARVEVYRNEKGEADARVIGLDPEIVN